MKISRHGLTCAGRKQLQFRSSWNLSKCQGPFRYCKLIARETREGARGPRSMDSTVFQLRHCAYPARAPIYATPSMASSVRQVFGNSRGFSRNSPTSWISDVIVDMVNI